LNKDYKTCFRTKIGFRRQQGFQPELVCLLFWSQKAPVVNNVKIFPKHDMFLFGTDESVVCLDYLNRTILLNISLVDLYTNQDPFHRHQKSPKKSNKSLANESEETSAGELVSFTKKVYQLIMDCC
jgi:syntaxin-binding protein 5